jgi:hypothetical protein
VRFKRSKHRWDNNLDIAPIADGLGEDAADREVIKQLRKLGAHLDQERSLRAYLFFRQQPAAAAAADDLSGEGFKVEVTEDAGVWLARPERTMLVSPASVAALRAQLTEIALRHGGEYDGWEASPEP